MSEMRSAAASMAQNPVTLGCFEVCGQCYAIEVGQIREIVRWQPVTALPNAPALIDGVIDLRGAVIPVVDMGRALGGDPTRVGPATRILVLELDDLVIGAVVDCATDILSTEGSTMDDPPALTTHAGYEAVRAVVRRSDAEPVLVLSLEHLLEKVYQSAPPSPGDGQ